MLDYFDYFYSSEVNSGKTEGNNNQKNGEPGNNSNISNESISTNHSEEQGNNITKKENFVETVKNNMLFWILGFFGLIPLIVAILFSRRNRPQRD